MKDKIDLSNLLLKEFDDELFGLKDTSEKYIINNPHDKIFRTILGNKKQIVETINTVIMQEEKLTEEDIEKEFMNNEERYLYYEDEDSKFVVLPMNGGIQAVFVLGDASSVMENLNKATYETVNVTIPKFENETSFDNNELIDYLKARGAGSAFTRDADFSLMSKEMSLMITDIIQKTKYHQN